jgi:hypothetical protein
MIFNENQKRLYFWKVEYRDFFFLFWSSFNHILRNEPGLNFLPNLAAHGASACQAVDVAPRRRESRRVV